jgi:hypothetical protein
MAWLLTLPWLLRPRLGPAGDAPHVLVTGTGGSSEACSVRASPTPTLFTGSTRDAVRGSGYAELRQVERAFEGMAAAVGVT